MKKLVFLIFLFGCEEFSFPKTDWADAPKEYHCTEDQMIKLEKETIFCSSNTEYTPQFCYGAAIMRNCSEKKDEKN